MKLVKSSLLVKLVILILVVYATVTLVSLRKQITEKNEQEAILNSSIAATQQENNRIQTPSTRWAPTRASRQSRAISSAWSTRAISSSMTWANDGRPFRRGVYAS